MVCPSSFRFLRLAILAHKIDNFAFRLVKIFYHMNSLTYHAQCLDDILFDKAGHGSFEIVLDDVHVGEAQL